MERVAKAADDRVEMGRGELLGRFDLGFNRAGITRDLAGELGDL